MREFMFVLLAIVIGLGIGILAGFIRRRVQK